MLCGGKNIYLVTKVALGGLGVGVDDPGVRNLGPVGHLHLHPGWPPCNSVKQDTSNEYFCCMGMVYDLKYNVKCTGMAKKNDWWSISLTFCLNVQQINASSISPNKYLWPTK